MAAVVFDELFADQQLLENEVPTIALKKRLTDKINKIKFYQAKFSRLLNSSVEWVDTASIYQGRIRTGIIVNYDEANPFEFLNLCSELFIAKMNEFFRVHLHYKVYCRLNVDFVLQAAENTSEKNFCSKAAVMSHDDNYADWFAQHVIEPLKNKIEQYQERGSGYALSFINYLEICVNHYNPLRAGSYIPLPRNISAKKAVINVKNESDDLCFLWCILAWLRKDDS